MKYIKVIKTGFELYRFDLVKTPNKWSTDFKNSNYSYGELGNKNQAGFFFFLDSIDKANNFGENYAINKNQDYYYITKTQTSNQLKLIDFSNSYNIYQMLCVLKDLGIDVLTKNFKTFENEETFATLREIFYEAEREKEMKKKTMLIKKLKVHSKSNFNATGLFGQRLTDFTNGKIFKELVQELYPEIDGYCWNEFEDGKSNEINILSYCLFNSNKLSNPKAIRIELDSLR